MSGLLLGWGQITPYEDKVPSANRAKNSGGTKSVPAFLHVFDGKCYLCGKTVSPAEATRDHIIPVSRGGRNVRWNRALAHGACNWWKGDKYVAFDIVTRTPVLGTFIDFAKAARDPEVLVGMLSSEDA